MALETETKSNRIMVTFTDPEDADMIHEMAEEERTPPAIIVRRLAGKQLDQIRKAQAAEGDAA